ncbi:MAG: holo-ACP synthase [Gemmatimonadota bacterium]|nr:holo-ACP synthase [Gemmatimonadota bacterium]
MSAPDRDSLAIGTDLVRVADVRASIERFGTRYLTRVYTANEVSDCSPGTSPSAPARLAARFAAKEAVRKALRVGDAPIDLRTIEVRRHPEGWCDIILHRETAALAARAGISDLSLSMSHEGAYASAFVVARKAAPAAHNHHG